MLLISSASKYFRLILEGPNEHVSISFSHYHAIETVVHQLRKDRGTSWTLLNDPNIWGKQVAQRYLQNNLRYLWSPILPWSRPCSKSLFRAFFLGMVYIVIIQKISFEWDRLQAFSNIDHDFDNICFLKKLRKKFDTKFGSWSTKKVQNFLFGGFNEWKISVYFGPLFVLVKTQLDALTNSALYYIHVRWHFY